MFNKKKSFEITSVVGNRETVFYVTRDVIFNRHKLFVCVCLELCERFVFGFEAKRKSEKKKREIRVVVSLDDHHRNIT